MIAICSTFNRFKGFGFAVPADASGQPADSQADIFVHAKTIRNKKYLAKGDLIFYEIGTFKGRPTAINVMVLTTTEPENKAVQS